jgi:hypothetical protein
MAIEYVVRRWLREEVPEETRLAGGSDTILIPPGAQYGATACNPEQRKPPRNAAFATSCTPLQRLMDHS